MQEAKALKVTVKKSSDDTGTDFNLDAAATQYIEFSETTSIYQIQIQPTEAATLVISEIAVNAESTKPAEPEPTSGQTGVNISLLPMMLQRRPLRQKVNGALVAGTSGTTATMEREASR